MLASSLHDLYRHSPKHPSIILTSIPHVTFQDLFSLWLSFNFTFSSAETSTPPSEKCSLQKTTSFCVDWVILLDSQRNWCLDIYHIFLSKQLVWLAHSYLAMSIFRLLQRQFLVFAYYTKEGFSCLFLRVISFYYLLFILVVRLLALIE